MEFLDPKFRKRRKTQLFIGYFLMAILVSMLTGFLVLVTQGYGFDSTSRQIVKNGTIFLTSDPDGADIYINGAILNNKTNKRLSLPENTYTFSLQKDNYRDWTREVWVGGSTLRRIVYPKLIPSLLQSEKVAQLSVNASSILTSPTNKWFSVINTTSPSDIYFIETSQPSKEATIISLASATAHSFEGAQLAFVEWDNTDTVVLLKAQYADTTSEYFIVNRKEKSAISLNSLAGIGVYQVKFKGDDFRKVYLLNNLNNELLLIDTNSGTKEIVVAENVAMFASGTQDNAAYIVENKSNDGDKTHSLYYKNNDKTVKMNDINCISDCTLELFSYAGDNYLYFGSVEDGMSIYKNIEITTQDQKQVATYDVVSKIKVAESPKTMLSPSGQFVLISTKEKVVVFDVAYNETFLIDKSVAQVVGWADEFRLLYVAEGNRAAISDFDGSNYYPLDVQLGSTESTRRQTVFSAKLRTMISLDSSQHMTNIYVTDLR